jgi:hypothetical protein
MKRIPAMIYLSDRTVAAAKSPDELLNAYIASAALFHGVCKRRAAKALAVVQAMRKAEREQLEFREILNGGTR